MKDTKEFPHIFQQLDEVFGSQGILAQGLSSYVLRRGQIDMANLVAETLQDHRVLVVEAGTGTGKTLAYLVPAIIWTSENDTRVVISTNTINLQDQIWNQDLPLLEQFLPYEFLAVRLKGRSNYLCLRKWMAGWQLTLGDLWGRELHARLEDWVKVTETGDKSELNLASVEESLWQKYSADDFTCHGARCKWGQECFLRRVRSSAAKANLILVNHSLLLTDAGGSFGILPEFTALIVDEAHNLSAAAVNQFSLSLNQGELQEIYNLTGQVPPLTKAFSGKASNSGSNVKEDLQALQDNRTALFRCLSETFETGNKFFSRNSVARKQLRLQIEHHEDFLDFLFGELTEVSNALSKIKEAMSGLEQLLEGLGENDDFRRIASVVENTRQKVLGMSRYDEEEQVLWLEGKDREFSIRSAPLNGGRILSDLLYSRLDSVVLTSATLRLKNSFDYFAEELGLAYTEDIIFEKVASAFDFSNQARIFVAADLPEPDWEHDRMWVEACGEAVAGIAKACTGNVLALFTSHRHLLQTNELLRVPLHQEGIRVLAHDIDGDRYSLVQAIKTDQKTVLLGTGSFWEGIDVPGDCLQCVIICKLPFPVPDSPLFEAKVEKAREAGRNPFTSIFLPVCTVRLLQGIGRLIRSEEDFGFAVILDTRLISRGYSRFIVESLPDEPRVTGTADICASIEEMISFRNEAPQGHNDNTLIED